MSAGRRMRRQRGVALITVLLVLALATVTIVSMSGERQLDIRRTENQLRGDQAWAHAHSLESWALARLRDEAGDRQKPLRLREDGGAELRASLAEAQGKINLNNLLVDGEVSQTDAQRLRRLLRHLELNGELLDAILDWIDADGDIRYPFGAEDEAYSRRQPPGRAANREFADLGELRLIQGVTPEVFRKLRPFVSVLPGYAPINVNTAAPEVLRCLADDISADRAASMFRASGKPFADLDEFLKDEAVLGSGIGRYGLSVQSKYFLLAGSVDMGGTRLRFESLLRKDGDGAVAVVGRAREGWQYD
ncbi:type II secretion system minor pseudopilin GspK [Methylomonas sp. SURF-2]|uniref:Type II secretion system protein K n=1 Tax=Methylomonas subterranea TaxID=2952225 RepID=A0ABT1TDH6_9GAMM|nr:type II secretion system minor pseudopilin GspK [Methylomonas sp. SURF-2]MCQ8103508.1 type II secretion system minor pseudopilin GspK [Methylomonas sp. SURF-2]